MRIRHAVLPLLSVSAVYAMLSAFNTEEASMPSAATAPAQQQAAYIPQDVPAQAVTAAAALATASPQDLRAAFTAVPAAPSFDYAAQATAQAPAANAQDSAVAQKIATLQQGISKILTSGANLLVSSRKVAIGKGDTLMDILVRNDVPRDEAYEAIQALSKVYDPRDLNAGREITVFFHRDPSIADPKFTGLSIEKDIVNTVTVNRDDKGDFTADKQEKDVSKSVEAWKGTINSSLYVSAKSAGVPDAVIAEMIKMYSMSVDFQRDLHEGDKFEVLYEAYKTDSGDIVTGKGNILYASLILDDRSLPLYRFSSRDGNTDYYDAAGKSTKRTLMKTPIDGARISSGFGMRNHPVLGFSKMHKGIDFAAPRGTPIYAAGDGKIVKMGPFSSFGNYVRIHHAGVDTAYAHMKGFKPGLKAGSFVKQGQVIGYVGTTGRSTGPHLHFEVLKNNVQINPKSMKMDAATALAGADLKKFKATVSDVQQKLEKGTAPAIPVASAGGTAGVKVAAKN